MLSFTEDFDECALCFGWVDEIDGVFLEGDDVVVCGDCLETFDEVYES